MNKDQLGTLGVGFDVSHHNVDDRGEAIDWSVAFEAGYRFVIIKATDGEGFTDPEFANNVDGAVAAGFVVGAYHFLRPGHDAEAQADLFLNRTSQVGLENLELGAAVDVEDPDDDRGAWTRIDRATRIGKVDHWLQRVEQVFSDRPLVYCIPQWWAQHFGLEGDFSGHPLWAASPNETPDLRGTTWQSWTVWQFNDLGTIPGVGHKSVDLNQTQ